MGKIYTALGLMSGTSLDGVDVSIIESDGDKEFSPILDRYFEYDKELVQKILNMRSKISSREELNGYINEIKDLEREITLFHGMAVKRTLEISKSHVDLIGFHGQTILHSPEKQFSLQLGDGQLLSQLTKTKVIYKFRENDLKNGGQGAPLAPIFHKFLINKKKIKPPITILNLGGIANITTINHYEVISSSDIGPGNCLIDSWVRLNSKIKFFI